MKKIHLRKQLVAIILIAVIAASMPFLGSCMPGKPAAEVEPIKIGFLAPMTGAFASDAEEMIKRATLAVEDINAAGGLVGRPVELVPVDTKELMPEDVVSAFKLLKGQGVDVFISDYAGEPTDVQMAMAYDIPYFSWNDSRTAEKYIAANVEECDNVYRVSPSGREYATIPYKIFTELLPYDYPNKKIALLTLDQEWCMDISTDLRALVAEDPEWEIVIDEETSYGTTEYGPQLIKIGEEEPGLIFFSSFAAVELAAFMEQFLADPTDSLFYNPYTPCIPEFAELLGENADGIFWGDQCSNYGTPAEEVFNGKFEERWGYVPKLALTYDTIMLWAEAVKRAGDPSDYEAVLQAALDYPYTGICGTYKINPDTHVGTPGFGYIAHRFFQIQIDEGEWKDIALYLHDEPHEGTGKYAGSFEIPPWIGK